MIIVLIILALVTFYKVSIHPYGRDDYLSFDSTNAIKGLFILIVFCSHFNGYVNAGGLFDLVFDLIGQRMVTMFMLYSGYGVMESISGKGMGYIRNMPKNRIAKVLFDFDIALVLYVVVALIINKGQYPYSAPHTLLSLIGWESIGNSNWYIFTILIAYGCTYIAFRINNAHGVRITAALLISYCVLMNLFSNKAWIWYDTVLCYPLGMLLSKYRKQFERMIKKNGCCAAAAVMIMIIQALSYKYSNIFLIREMAMLSFSILVIVISFRVKIGNPILIFFGRHLFSVYILQRIPMILLNHFGQGRISDLLFFFCSICITLLLIKPFESVTHIAWNGLFSGKKEDKNA